MGRGKVGKYKIKRIISNTILHVVLIILSLTMVLPFLWMVIASFKPNIDIISVDFKLFSPNWTLENYKKVLSEVPIGRAYFNSLLVATVVTVCVILTSSAAGFLFSKLRFRGRDMLFFVVLASVMIPPQIVLIPLYFMITRMHLVNTYLGLVAPFIMSAFGIFLMRQFTYGIPTDLIEAARMDGASDWRIYFNVILPLVRSSISVVGMLTFLWTFDEFLWPLVIVNNMDMMTLPLVLAKYAMAEGGVIAGSSMATATLVVIPVLIVYVFFQRFFISSLSGISMAGLKG